MADDPRTGLIALAAALDVINGTPKAAKMADAGVAEIDRLRAALAAAEAERDRAMHACEQIGSHLAAAEARAEKAERERDAALVLLQDCKKQLGSIIHRGGPTDWEGWHDEIALLLAALTPARNEKED